MLAFAETISFQNLVWLQGGRILAVVSIWVNFSFNERRLQSHSDQCVSVFVIAVFLTGASALGVSANHKKSLIFIWFVLWRNLTRTSPLALPVSSLLLVCRPRLLAPSGPASTACRCWRWRTWWSWATSPTPSVSSPTSSPWSTTCADMRCPWVGPVTSDLCLSKCQRPPPTPLPALTPPSISISTSIRLTWSELHIPGDSGAFACVCVWTTLTISVGSWDVFSILLYFSSALNTHYFQRTPELFFFFWRSIFLRFQVLHLFCTPTLCTRW